jgi:hypothetical protein
MKETSEKPQSNLRGKSVLRNRLNFMHFFTVFAFGGFTISINGWNVDRYGQFAANFVFLIVGYY